MYIKKVLPVCVENVENIKTVEKKIQSWSYKAM